MRTQAVIVAAWVAMACGSSQPSPAPPPSPPSREPAAVVEVASAEDRQRAKAVADAVCGCVRDRGHELACVRNIKRSAPPQQQSDPEVARQLERARICVRLADLQDAEDQRSQLSRFLEALLR